MKTRVCLEYFVNGSLCKQFFASNSPKNFVTLRPLTLFQPKVRATELQKSSKICDN